MHAVGFLYFSIANNICSGPTTFGLNCDHYNDIGIIIDLHTRDDLEILCM